MPRHKRPNLLRKPTQFTGDLQGQDNLACSHSQRRLGTLKMELMHSQVEASTENTWRSAFFQFLTGPYENKERCPSTRSPGVFAITTF